MAQLPRTTVEIRKSPSTQGSLRNESPATERSPNAAPVRTQCTAQIALAQAPTLSIRDWDVKLTAPLLHNLCNKGSGISTDIYAWMFAVLALMTIPLRPLDFPKQPIARELDEGVRVYRHGKGLDRLYQDDRKVTGTWFDGKVRRDADHVLWLSPSLISRWLGYLEAKEKWPEGELERRWTALRMDLGGRMSFVVRVCTMPRMDLLEGEISERIAPIDPKQLRFLWTSSLPPRPSVPARMDVIGLIRQRETPLNQSRRYVGGMRVEPKQCLLSEFWSRSASEVLKEDWWMRVPFGEALKSEFDCLDSSYAVPLGDFYSATYLVSLPLPEGPLAGPGFELRSFSPRKERVARFELFGGK